VITATFPSSLFIVIEFLSYFRFKFIVTTKSTKSTKKKIKRQMYVLLPEFYTRPPVFLNLCFSNLRVLRALP